jgi:ankyrin repeat protein
VCSTAHSLRLPLLLPLLSLCVDDIFQVDAGAEVNACNADGDTVLDIALNAGCTDVATYLASKGAFSAADVKRQIDLVNQGRRGLFRLW